MRTPFALYAALALFFALGITKPLWGKDPNSDTNAAVATKPNVVTAPKTTNAAPSVPLAALQPPQKLRSTTETVATPPSASQIQMGAYLEGVRVGAILARQNAGRALALNIPAMLGN